MGNSLIHDLQHHARDKSEVASTLALAFATMLNPSGWQVRHGGRGNNSWRIFKVDKSGTKVWYFTGYEKGTICARDAYLWREKKEVFFLKSRVDAVRFARHLLA